MNANSISVHNLRKRFPGFLLDDISFQVPCGRIVGFIGENGAGKSTTIRLILDQLRRDGGSIEIFGEDNTKYLQHGSIGVVFDECNFHDVLNAHDLDEILSDIYNTWDQALYTQYLKQFGIPPAQRIKELSKGMKMKLSIICAISHHPDILILDEATTGLDPVVRDEILDLFLDFIQDEKHSVLFSTHITSDIQRIADYVVLIHNGKLIFFSFLRLPLITDPFDTYFFRGSLLFYGSLYKTHETDLRLKRFFGFISHNGFLSLFDF